MDKLTEFTNGYIGGFRGNVYIEAPVQVYKQAVCTHSVYTPYKIM